MPETTRPWFGLPAPRTPAGRTALLLAGLFAIGLVLRVANNTPSVYSFWVDEADYSNRSIYIVQHGWAYDPGYLFDHPPLFLYLQAIAFSLFGSEWYVARGLAVALGMLTMAVLFLAGRAWKDDRLGLLMAAAFAFQPAIVVMNRQVVIENLLLLFLAASFLMIVRFERTGRRAFFLSAVLLLALAVITKLTAIVFLPAFAGYVVIRKLHKTPLAVWSALLFCAIVIPVIWAMLPHGFIEFHLRKTSGTGWGYYIGDTFVEFGHLAALARTFIQLNIGVLPFAVFLWDLRRERPAARFEWRTAVRALPGWMAANPVPTLAILWVVSSYAFFSFFTFFPSQYIYTIMVPMLILMGAAVYRSPRVALFVLALILVDGCVGAATQVRTASNETVEFLERHVQPGDTLLASDAPVFRYYFPDNPVSEHSVRNIMEKNATYLVLKTSLYRAHSENATLAALLNGNYTKVFETFTGSHEINFVVLRRN